MRSYPGGTENCSILDTVLGAAKLKDCRTSNARNGRSGVDPSQRRVGWRQTPEAFDLGSPGRPSPTGTAQFESELAIAVS